MTTMTAEKFTRYVRDVAPSGDAPMTRLARKQYVLRCGLLYLIDYVASDFAIANPQRLRVIRDLSNPEVEAQPQRWAEQFEGKAEEAKLPGVALYYRLAGDLCAMFTAAPTGDMATATDGNGDVQFDEVA